MKLYLISQHQNRGYDTFFEAVVCATGRQSAAGMNPRTGNPMTDDEWKTNDYWCNHGSLVDVKYIGNAAAGIKEGVVLASFNAG
jgi:hypothetical protein